MSVVVTRHLSVVEVEVTFVDAAVAADQFAWVWAAAERPLRRPTAAARYRVERVRDGFAVRNAIGGSARVLPEERDVVPFLEAALYAELAHAHRVAGATVLHGASFAFGDRAFVVLGASGAGKSALARAALEAGSVHHGDEHVVVFEGCVTGLPRAIHLDPLPADEPPPAWHAGADRQRYRFVRDDGVEMSLPLVAIPPSAVPSAPVPVGRVVVVHAGRGGADVVEAVSELEAVRSLVESTHEGGDALALTLTPGFPGVRLRWRDPALALATLLAFGA